MELSALRAVEIEINSHCNRSCSYCPNSMDSRIESGSMKKDVYQRILDQLEGIGFKGRISYDFYNEPLLCSNLDLFLEMTRKQLPDSEIHLYTNGSLLSVQRFRELHQRGVTWFIVTKHEQEKEKEYIFDQTFSVLSEIEKKAVTFRHHQDLRLTNRGGMLKHIKKDHNNLSSMPCFIPSMMLTITVKGNILTCFEDFYQKHMMGNICEETLQAIWNKAEYIQFRKKLLLGLRKDFDICRNCSRVEVMPYKMTAAEKTFQLK